MAFILVQSFLITGLLMQKRRRTSAEASFKKSEERHRNLFESALEGIYETSPQGQILTANPALARMLAYDSPEEVVSSIKDTANQIWANPKEREDYLRILDEQNVIRGYECQFLRKDGTKFWVSLNTRRVTGPDGQTLLYSGFLEDISERKQAEETLKERLMLESLMSEISTRFINIPVNRIDTEIENSQRRICESLGLDLCVLWQMSVESPLVFTLDYIYSTLKSWPRPGRIHAQEVFPWQLQKMIDGETLAFSTEELPPEAARDKENRRLLGVKSSVTIPLSGDDGKINRVMSFNTLNAERKWSEETVRGLKLLAQVFNNAIERKRSEESLRESEGRLNLVTTVSGAGLWVLELDTRKVWVSTMTRDLFHLSPDEKLNYDSFFKVIHPDDHEQVHQAVRETLQSGKSLKIKYRVVLPNGSIRWISTQGQQYPRTAPNRLMGVSLDITERIEDEAEARQDREALAHMTRVAAMGELTSSLAHEINQPLTAILSNAEAGRRFLSRANPDIYEVRQILDDIIRDDKRASQVVRKVRSLLKNEETHYEFLDLNETIREVAGLIREEYFLAGLTIRTELSQDLMMIKGDRSELQQVMLNLMLNAAAAMKDCPQTRRKIIIRTAMAGSATAKVSVTDFGTGIDETDIERLFEPFYTTRADGLGMGLSISQKIIKDHGGTIEASNNAEGGATFAFSLPVHLGDSL